MARFLVVFDLNGRLFADDPTIRTIGVIVREVDDDRENHLETDFGAFLQTVIRTVEQEHRERDPTIIPVFRFLQRIR